MKVIYRRKCLRALKSYIDLKRKLFIPFIFQIQPTHSGCASIDQRATHNGMGVYSNYNDKQTLESFLFKDTELLFEHLRVMFVFLLFKLHKKWRTSITRWRILQSGVRKYNSEEEMGLSCSREFHYNSDKQDSQSREETYPKLPSKKNADRLCDSQPVEFL